MLAGAAFLHKYQSSPSRPSYHKMLAFSFAVIISTNFFFLWSDTPFFQGFWNFIAAIPYFFVEVMVDLSVISIGKHVDELLLIITACFGIGALAAPIIIRILGISAYIVFAVILGALIPLILYLPSPEASQQQKNGQTKEQKGTINTKTLVLLCSMEFVYIGLVITKLAWTSSYAVLACDMTKQKATVFTSLNAAFNIGTKFVWLFLSIKGSDRLKIATRTLVVVSILSLLIAELGWAEYALLFDSILMGIFMSPVSSQILAIGSEFGRPVTEGQASKIAAWGKVGEGILTMLCGSLMNLNINIYFFFSIIVCLALWASSHSVLAQLKEGSKEIKQKQLQMQLIE